MKLHLLALFLLAGPQLGSVLEHLRADTNAPAEISLAPRAAPDAPPARSDLPSPSPASPSPALRPLSQR